MQLVVPAARFDNASSRKEFMTTSKGAPEPEPTRSTSTPEKPGGDIEQPSLECLIENYHAIAEWIRFADAKAAVVLTVGAALAGFLIPSVRLLTGENASSEHLVPYWHLIALILFVCYVIFFLLSAVFSFLCINPLRRRGSHPSLGHCDLFHPAAISSTYGSEKFEAFENDSKRDGEDGMIRQVRAAILLDSHISSSKYNRVTNSIRLFAISSVFGFAFFLISQF